MTKMMKYASTTLFCASVLAMANGCSSSPKVLVDHSFRGKTKTSKIMLELSGEETNGKKLFNTHVRLCDLKDHKETACKDTMVLPNVVADSVY
jgi:hypothetical protein